MIVTLFLNVNAHLWPFWDPFLLIESAQRQSLTSCCGLHFPTRHGGWAYWWPSSGILFTGHWLRVNYCLLYLPSLRLNWNARWDLPPKHTPPCFSLPPALSVQLDSSLGRVLNDQEYGSRAPDNPGIRWDLKFLSFSCPNNTLLVLGNTQPWSWKCGHLTWSLFIHDSNSPSSKVWSQLN